MQKQHQCSACWHYYEFTVKTKLKCWYLVHQESTTLLCIPWNSGRDPFPLVQLLLKEHALGRTIDQISMKSGWRLAEQASLCVRLPAFLFVLVLSSHISWQAMPEVYYADTPFINTLWTDKTVQKHKTNNKKGKNKKVVTWDIFKLRHTSWLVINPCAGKPKKFYFFDR